MVNMGTDVRAATNVTLTVDNQRPTVGSLTCSFGGDTTGTFDNPSPGSRNSATDGDYTVFCDSVITDNNSYQNISKVWAVFYLTSSGESGDADVDVRYSDSDCASQSDGDGTDETYRCTPDQNSGKFEYYADAGAWTAKIYAWDGGTFANNSNTYSQTISASATVEYSSSLNFGTMGPGVSPVNNNQTFSTNNTGNSDIAITVNGTSLNCTIGTIPVSSISYALDASTAYASCGNLSTSAAWTCETLSISDRESSGTVDQNTTYWGISIPTGVQGTCSGSLWAHASGA